MGFFSRSNTMADQAEIEQLINEVMEATYQWESTGEKAGGNEIIEAATNIRRHTGRIVDLYEKIKKSKGNGNLYINIRRLSPPLPPQIHIQMAIMGILEFAVAIGEKNSSFSDVIPTHTLEKFTRIISNP